MCRGLRGHRRLLEEMRDGFRAEWRRATTERFHLEELWRNIVWYNFEIFISDWNFPWHESDMLSRVELRGVRIENSNGNETGTFPIYYAGTLLHATHIPPALILSEIQLAKEYEQECEDAYYGVYDWAPGGWQYEQLARITQVGRDVNALPP